MPSRRNEALPAIAAISELDNSRLGNPKLGTSADALAAVAVFPRKLSSRNRLLAAATGAFCRDGYFSVSVEDISAAARVSRMTFYRHFSGKAAIATEIFRETVEASMPRFLAIAQHDRLEHEIVAEWIRQLFEADRRSGQLLRVFLQANSAESDFTDFAHSFIENLICELGKFMPAFALDKVADRRAWLEAWLLLYEIMDHSNHAARGAGISTDPITIAILADRFLHFVDNATLQR